MDRISQLLYKKITGTLTPEENSELETWAAGTPERKKLLDRMADSEAICRKYQRRNLVDTDAPCDDMQRRIAAIARPRILRRRAIAAAASVAVLIMASAVYFMSSRHDSIDISSELADATEEIRHGESKATLSTSTGNTVALNSHDSGAGMSELLTPDNDNSNIEELCLDVPRGGEFKIVLEDSTEVWLNSESQLRYPEVFASNERRVQVSGEVYFKVKPDHNRPFYVESAGQVIRVYGTSFNIKSYGDENMTYTTLETGSVSLSPISGEGGELFLSPGHQACLNRESNNIDMKVVDTEVITSWRHGKFVFEEQPLENIMRDLSRWYNFEYEFTDPEIAEYVFMGSIPRYADFHTATVILEKSGDLSIVTEGSKVTVSKRRPAVNRISENTPI